MSTDVADPEVLEVAWDLDPLLDGDPSDPVAAVDAMLAEAQERADALRRALRRPRRRARRARPRRGDARARRAPGARRARRHLRGLHFSTDTADPARGALYQRVQERATPIETKLLFFELEWAAVDDARADELLADRGPRLLPPPPAHGAPLPPAPALRARGEDPHREGADLPQRLGPPVRGADRRARGRARGRRRAGLARGRAVAPAPARPRGPRARRRARDRRRSRPACARAASSSTRCWPTRWSTTGCAATRTGSRAATSPTRPPTSPSRRSSPPSATATSCRGAGTA